MYVSVSISVSLPLPLPNLTVYDGTDLDDVADPSFPDQSSPECVLGEQSGDVFLNSALKQKITFENLYSANGSIHHIKTFFLRD